MIAHGELLELAKDLISETGKWMRDETQSLTYSFRYVVLRRFNKSHAKFFEVIDSLAGQLNLNPHYCRISHYSTTDYITPHIDTESLGDAFSIRLNDGKSRLRIGDNVVEEFPGSVTRIPAGATHEVTVGSTDRYVILFWNKGVTE
ncbi:MULTISPECIES: hypothetical protein [Enterobacterales]|uniref:hypothetical protein n=1 Tax=Enterobacterales TaxID=91347 RepID=UPI000F73A6CB|nr:MULTISPECIES: hypothetical protein [Enterobacterales]HCA9703478.1 hypothetical protein [Klebsiella variicola subsp. variicola]MBL6016360.1 hypothetical protein [Klebsiella pneumoniae]MDK4774618.1 hypothetical protein [Serratia nevei]MDK4803987.1 hypothetical protein [Serratia nevei]MDK4991956.1 hypothetical protein [Enterobacter hormaechei]